MSKIVTLLLFTLTLQTLNAQDLSWATPSPLGGNDAINGVSQNNNGDRFVVSMKNLNTSFFSPIGQGTISKFSESGIHQWDLPLEGQLYASDMIANDDHFWVCGHIDSVMTYNNSEILADGMFIMQCDMEGDMEWIFTNDSLLGHHSVLGLTPEETPVVSGLRGWNEKSVLTELNLNGEVERTKDLPAAMVSDFDITSDGELVVGGNGFQVPGFDGIVIDEFIPYVNYLAFLNSDWTAQWIYVSEYITIDHHHRVETLGDQVFYYAFEGENVPLESDVLIFNFSGELLDSLEIQTETIFIQEVEMVAHSDQLTILHMVTNSGNFDLTDTLRLTKYYPDSDLLETYDITGEFHPPMEGRGRWRIDAKECHASLAGVSEINTIQFGEEDELMFEGADGHFALVNLNLNCLLTSVSESEHGRVFYPNPANDVINIQKSGQSLHQLELIDIRGQVVRRFPAGAQSIDVSALSSGIYLIRGNLQGEVFHERIVID